LISNNNTISLAFR